MKEFFISMYDKYTHFITIDWNNLFTSLGYNFLIVLVTVIGIIILAYLIGVLDDFDNPFLYVIGKIFSIPIVLSIIILAILFIISLIIASIIFVVLLTLILFNIISWFFP